MKKIVHILLAAASFTALAFGAVSCSADGAADIGGGGNGGGGNGDGQGGSMARFAVVGDYMYVVDNNTLKTVRLTDPAHPDHLEYKDQVPDGWGNAGGIETIFPDRERNLLFIGSQTAMYIYDASNPEFLTKRGTASHITSCDPVVAYGDYAYVTLNTTTGWRCGTGENTLNIYDISYLNNANTGTPQHLKSIGLPSPMGLGIDGGRQRLFVCTNGMTMYDISNPVDPKPIDDLQNSVGQVHDGIIGTYDVIPLTDKAQLLLVGKDGLFKLGYGSDKLTLLDYIQVNKN